MKCAIPALMAAFIAAHSAHASTIIYSEVLTPVSRNGDTKFFEIGDPLVETFDFSSVNYDSIDRFEMSVSTFGARDESAVLFIARQFEWWLLRIDGSVSGVGDDLFEPLFFESNPFTISAASDIGPIDVFAHSVATGALSLGLDERSADNVVIDPSIDILSVSLDVYGTLSTIPLPAGLPLLLAGLGGFGLLRLRNVTAA